MRGVRKKGFGDHPFLQDYDVTFQKIGLVRCGERHGFCPSDSLKGTKCLFERRHPDDVQPRSRIRFRGRHFYLGHDEILRAGALDGDGLFRDATNIANVAELVDRAGGGDVVMSRE